METKQDHDILCDNQPENMECICGMLGQEMNDKQNSMEEAMATGN